MRGAHRDSHGAPPLARASAHGFVAGAAAGTAVAIAEAILAWGDARHFIFDAGGRLRFAIFLVGLYGSAGAALGALGGAGGAALLRFTRLGDAASAIARAHRRARDRDPRDALAGLSLALAGVPALAAALAAVYLGAYDFLADRRHPGLVVAVAMAAGIAAVAVAALATPVLARPLELLLRRIARRPRLARALSSPTAPLAAALVLAAAAAAAGIAYTWELLMLLPIDTALAAAFVTGLAIPAARMLRPATDALLAVRALARRGALAGLAAALVATTILAGGAPGARKAAEQYTGLGDPLMRAYGVVVDLHARGTSVVFGDGDCDPFDPRFGRGGDEIPPEDCVDVDAISDLPEPDPAFGSVPEAVPDRPHIVLITIDTLRHDHVGAYGYERDTTPNLDRLADEGTLFEHSWAHAPSTRYSMPAILTGRYPLQVDYDRTVQGWPGIGDDNTLIAEILSERGYRTAAYTNHWYFDPVRSMDRGFDIYDNSNARLHDTDPDAGPAETTGSSSRQQSDAALDFLDGHFRGGEGDPFFLWVHYYDPHYVYEKREGFDFGDEREDLYDSEIAFTDHHIGRVLDDLRERGVWDDTAVIVASDHGEGFGERGIYLHGYDLYAPQTRVPLLARVPATEPRRVRMPAGHVDILPTIANLVGAEPQRDMVGRSLMDLITGEHPDDEDRWIFQQLSYEGNNELRGAANHKCHVIYNISPHTSWELYRIDIDPDQERDIISDPGPCADAPAALAYWHTNSQIPLDAEEALLEAAPAIGDPLDVYLGAEAALLEVDLPSRPAARGDRFHVDYTFRARDSMAEDWQVFVHLESDGDAFFQGDHDPARPTTWWEEGDYIRYTRSIDVPRDVPPGEYEVWVGLFRGPERTPARSERVPVEENRARVGTITVR